MSHPQLNTIDGMDVEDDPAVARARRLLGAIRDQREILSDRVQTSKLHPFEASTTSFTERQPTDYNDQLTKRLLQSLNERRNRVQRMVEEKKEDPGIVERSANDSIDDGASACESLYYDESIGMTAHGSIQSEATVSITRPESQSASEQPSSHDMHSPTMDDMKQFYQKSNVSFGTEVTGTTAEMTTDGTRCSHLDGGAYRVHRLDERLDEQQDTTQTIYESDDESSFDDYPENFDIDSSSRDFSNAMPDHDDDSKQKDQQHSLADTSVAFGIADIDGAVAHSLGLDSNIDQDLGTKSSCCIVSVDPHEINRTIQEPLETASSGDVAKVTGQQDGETPIEPNRLSCDSVSQSDVAGEGNENFSRQRDSREQENNASQLDMQPTVEQACDTIFRHGGVVQGQRLEQTQSFDASMLSSVRETNKTTLESARLSRSYDEGSVQGNTPDETTPSRCQSQEAADMDNISRGGSKDVIQYEMDDEKLAVQSYHGSPQSSHRRSQSYDILCPTSSTAIHTNPKKRRTLSCDESLAATYVRPCCQLRPIAATEQWAPAATSTLGTCTESASPTSGAKKSLLDVNLVDLDCDVSTSSSLSDHSAADAGRALYIGDLYSPERTTKAETGFATARLKEGLPISEAHQIYCRKARVVVHDSDGEDLSLSLIVSDDSSMDFTTDSNTSGWISDDDLEPSVPSIPRVIHHDHDGDTSEFSGGVADSLLGDLDAMLDEPSLLGSCFSFLDDKEEPFNRETIPGEQSQPNEPDPAQETRWVLVSKPKAPKTSSPQRVKWNLPTPLADRPGRHQTIVLSEEEADEQCRVNRGLYAIALASGLQFEEPMEIRIKPSRPSQPQGLRLSTDFRCGTQGSLYDIAIRSGFDLTQTWNWKKQKKFIPARGGLWHISGLNKKMLRSRKPLTVKAKPASLDKEDDATVLPEEITDYECGANGSLFLAFETACGDYTATGSLYYLYSNTPRQG